MNTNSYERSKDRSPAYFISEYGVLKEANWDENDPPEGHHPLYWRKHPLTKDQLRELYEKSKGMSLVFARLIEAAHNITEVPNGTTKVPS